MLAATGAAATAVAVEGFKYNRENFYFDSGLRFQRYASGYAFAIEQAKQYREDIRNFTEIAVAKGELFSMLGVVFFVMNIQLIMAGRLGVHGPSPPGWFLGIYWANSAGAFLFLTTYVWLSLHAVGRAQAGGATMLTRHVRLPVPTPKQLDRARRTGNAFEKQRVTDVFRIPFVAPAPKETVAVDMESGVTDLKEFGSRRMPKWYEDEQKELNASANKNLSLGPDATPEHFELYRGAQAEWWAHEAYARIGLLYFMSCWMTALSLYSHAFIFTELRAMWPAWSVTPIFCVAHWGMLKIDILPEKMTRLSWMRLEDILPFAPCLALLAMQLEYSILPKGAWAATKIVIYVLAWIFYAIQVAWSFRLYDLAEPRQQPEQPDVPGTCWWPQDWWVPPAFNGTIYVISPPNHLEAGVANCLQLEMKAAKKPTSNPTVVKQREVGPQLWPWKVFQGSLRVFILVCVFISAGFLAELVMGHGVYGDGYFLKQAGRTVRWPAHIQPWMAPWIREGHRDQMAHTGGSDRRLAEVSKVAQQLAALVGPLAKAIEAPKVPRTAKLSDAVQVSVAWPAQLVPTVLASQGNSLVALDGAGSGAIVTLPDAASPFVLSGVAEVIGAAWSPSGLVVTSRGGDVALCPGLPTAGSWDCQSISKLPLGGSAIAAAVAAMRPSGLRAAVAFEEESVVVIFDAIDGEWTPMGEVRLPEGVPHFSLNAAGDELLISSSNGGAITWRVGEAQPALVTAPKTSGAVLHSACSMGDRMAQLATGASGARALLLSSH